MEGKKHIYIIQKKSLLLVDLFKCSVYIPVLNLLMLGGTVEQLALAVPERLRRGGRAHTVSCWQIPANKTS